MKSTSRTFVLWSLFALSAGTVLSFVAASDDPRPGASSRERVVPEKVTMPVKEATSEKERSQPEIVGSLTDKPLASFQEEALDLAFRTASALPVEPHIKARSRAQEVVVATCLELDQPRRALGYLEQIDNWIRGTAYADLAFYCAQHGDTAVAEHCCDLAQKVCERAEKDGVQDWQRDRIQVTIAKTHAWFGRNQEAARLEAGVVPSESGKVETVRAMVLDADAFDQEMDALDAVVVAGDFDQVQNALEAYAQLFNSFYGDQDRRSRVEEKIKAAWTKLPIMVRVAVMMKLSGFALDHSDQAKGLDLVKETQGMMTGSTWLPRYQIPVMAQLAGLRYRAGDAEGARSEGDAARKLFDSEKESIPNIYRAEALRPLAEAYQSMGDSATALAVYKTAVEAGVVNPNSRPRAEDLSATCCSMALHGVEPDAELWARMQQIHKGLGDPW